MCGRGEGDPVVSSGKGKNVEHAMKKGVRIAIASKMPLRRMIDAEGGGSRSKLVLTVPRARFQDWGQSFEEPTGSSGARNIDPDV